MTVLPTNQEELYDLIIIGGGINGAAIARDAALRKLKVVLLEKNDFGSGASSKTSKLAHGGVRYLEQWQFGLVRESLHERTLLLKNAPHLVKPLPFLMPVYAQDPHSLWKINLGLHIYDLLAGDNDLPKHRRLNSQEILKQIPELRITGLKGGCSFHDAQMLDNRIVIENIVSAERAGAKVFNHTEVTRLIRKNGRIQGVVCNRSLTGQQENIHGKIVVNATGAWSDHIGEMEPNATHCKPSPTKGVHLLVPKLIHTNQALLLRAPQDGRVFFILPWGEFSMIGTTDTFYEGDPDHLVVDSVDVNYLLEAAKAFLPEKRLTEEMIVSSFAGLRPLVSQNVSSPSAIFREHVIQTSEGGLITLLGGKFTTHRLIAEEVVDQVMKNLKRSCPSLTKHLPLPGAAGPYSLAEVGDKLRSENLSDYITSYLLNIYGTCSLRIWEIMKEEPQSAKLLHKDFPHTYAELIYAVDVEHVRTFKDWLHRSTSKEYFSYDSHYENEVTKTIADNSVN